MARFFCIFHAFSFELNIFFDRRFPLICVFYQSVIQRLSHPRISSREYHVAIGNRFHKYSTKGTLS